MSEKEIILDYLDKLSKLDLTGYDYSLTLNYKKIVHDFNYVPFSVEEITSILNNYNDEITSFNLTVNNFGRWSEEKYENFFNNITMIFHSKGIVYQFASPYLSMLQPIEMESFDKLVAVLDIHKKASKELCDAIKN